MITKQEAKHEALEAAIRVLRGRAFESEFSREGDRRKAVDAYAELIDDLQARYDALDASLKKQGKL